MRSQFKPILRARNLVSGAALHCGLLTAAFLMLLPAAHAATIYTVTVMTDPATGTAANCTAGSTVDVSCSLRDAIAAANASGTATIYFSPKVIGSLALTQGNVAVTGTAVNLVGPGANILTLSGHNTSNILQVNTGANLSVSGLLFTAGNAANGGAISATGGLTVVSCAFMANQSSATGGGAIYSSVAALSVTSSTFFGNTAVGSGGAIYASGGSVVLNNSTLTGNAAVISGGGFAAMNAAVSLTNTTIAVNQSTGTTGSMVGIGGGLYLLGGTLSLANTAVAGNTAVSNYADVYPFGAITDAGGNLYGTGSSAASLVNPMLLPLADYGGPVQTMLPEPMSPLLCAGGTAQAAAAGLTLDERGATRTTMYGATTCVDSGAAQSKYSLSFVQQPSTTVTGLSITPSPTVQWKESGSALAVAGQAIRISAAAGTLSGNTSPATSAAGLATLSGLSISTAQTSDTLQATVPLAIAPAVSVQATSNTFNVVVPVTGFLITALPATATAGSAIGFTVTALQGSATATGYTGTITISSAQDSQLAFVGGGVMYTFTAADAGVHTFTSTGGAVFKTAGSDTLTVSDLLNNVSVTSAAITVSAASPASLAVVSGNGQTAPIGGTFAAPLAIKLVDAYGNPNSGVVVTFAGPASGAGISPASADVSTAADGTASLTAIANASSGSYNVTASTAGLASTVTFALNNTSASSRTFVSQVAPLPVSAGTGTNVPTTFLATLSDATQNSAGLPTGFVQFYNGGTAIGSPVAVVNAQATLQTTFPVAGTYTITAQYLGDANFSGSSSSTLVEVVSNPLYTISLNPTSLTISGGGNATTTLTITPTGNYQGTITYTCDGLPQYSSCIFLPAVVQLSGINVPQTVQLTVYTLGPANTSAHGGVAAANIFWLTPFLLIPLVAWRRRRLCAIHCLTVVLLVGLMGGLSGCGNAHFYTPLGTVPVAVNAVGVGTPGSASPNLNQTATLTLNVQ